MAYYFRVLTPNPQPIAVGPIWRRLMADGARARLSHGKEAGPFDLLGVFHDDGKAVCRIERNPTDTDLGRTEIAEFLAEITTAQPASAAAWLADYLAGVKTIYAIETLDGVSEKEGWGIVNCVRQAIVETVGGVCQADFQGFTNEQGFHILWQFKDEITGPWNMAVLKDGAWRTFTMDRANPDHRAAFQRGEVPAGSTPLG